MLKRRNGQFLDKLERKKVRKRRTRLSTNHMLKSYMNLHHLSSCHIILVYSHNPASLLIVLSTAGIEPTVILQFKGDQDDVGIIPHRTIALHYVIRPTGALVLNT